MATMLIMAHLARTLKIILAALAFSGALGCSYPWVQEWTQPGATELDYGRSVAHNRVQQVVNPPGGRSTGPPLGLAPDTAQTVLNMYNQSFVREAQERPKPMIVEFGK
jgi:hypothetical protein